MCRFSDYEKGGKQKEHYAEDDLIKRNCPLCNHSAYSEIYKERGAIGIVRCEACNLVYTNPMLRDPGKNYWGDKKKYYEEARLIFNGVNKSHRDINYIEDLQLIEKVKPTGNFLDIGTNCGLFLRHTQGKKWNVFGLEPSPALSEMAREYFGLNIKTSYLEDAGFENDFFDIITMTDVFEHISEPKKMMLQIRGLLKDDGILFIKVPNGNYSLLKFWLAKMTKTLSDYDIFDSYEHLTHFTHATLKKLLEDCGFKVRKTLIGKPIQLPVWHKYVGHFYEYPSPWMLDIKGYTLRILFYWISRIEFLLRFGKTSYFASNIIMLASKNRSKNANEY